jgi:glutaredoxin
MKRLLSIALLAAALPVAAQYKWTGPDGRTVYGDQPPAVAKDVQKIGAGAAAAPATDPLLGAGFEVRRAAQNFPVVLYTTDNCGACDTARSLLRKRGVPFQERTIITSADYDAFIKLGHGNDLPVVTVGRQSLRGLQTQYWTALLDAAGYPAESQLPRNWQPPLPRPLVEVPAAPAAPDAPAGDPAREPAAPPTTTRTGPARF